MKKDQSVLFVDDDPDLSRLASAALRKFGFRVVVAQDSVSALEMVGRESKLGMVVADMVMPEMGGEDLACALRKKYPQLKVLLMSGYSQCSFTKVNWKGISFLPKPFGPLELLQKIQEL